MRMKTRRSGNEMMTRGLGGGRGDQKENCQARRVALENPGLGSGGEPGGKDRQTVLAPSGGRTVWSDCMERGQRGAPGS